MKSIVITALLAFPAFGIVESVRETQLAEAPHGLTGAFEQGARVEPADGHPPFQP